MATLAAAKERNARAWRFVAMDCGRWLPGEQAAGKGGCADRLAGDCADACGARVRGSGPTTWMP